MAIVSHMHTRGTINEVYLTLGEPPRLSLERPQQCTSRKSLLFFTSLCFFYALAISSVDENV